MQKTPPTQTTHLHKTALFFAAAGAVFFIMYVLRKAFSPFAVSFLVAYFLNPWVTQWYGLGIARWISALFMLSLLFLVIFLFFLTAIPFFKIQIDALLQHAPSWGVYTLSVIDPWLKNTLPATMGKTLSLESLTEDTLKDFLLWALQLVADMLNSSGLALFHLLSFLIIFPIASFYFLKDWPVVIKGIHALAPGNYRPIVRGLFEEIDRSLGNYIKTQFEICLILSLYYTVSLWCVGINFFIFLGCMGGFLSFIPYLGFVTAFFFGVSMGLIQGLTGVKLVGLLMVYGGGQALESMFLTPYMLGGRIGLNPLWMLFSLLVAGQIGGFTGVLFAIPLACIVGASIRFFFLRYKNSPFYRTLF